MKKDLRVIKTKAAIENAFMDLVRSKGYSNVSMIEIAEKAMVNRNTIYLHYGTKEGILETLITDAFAESFDNFNLASFMGSHASKKKIELIFVRLFEVLDENKDFYTLVLRDTSMTGFLEQEARKLRTRIFEVFSAYRTNEVGFNFLLNGIFGVVSNYLLFNEGTKEENIKLLSEFTIQILKNLVRKK